MKARILALFVVVSGVVAHDLVVEPCGEWYRIPLQKGCDMAFREIQFGHPLYEAAYGASFSQDLRAFRLENPWDHRDPRGGGRDGWTDLQAGTFTVVPPQQLLIVMPPGGLDRQEFLEEFRAINPRAVPVQGAAGIPPFVLVQVGGGVEGLELQILLEETGLVRVWKRTPRRGGGEDTLELVREARLPKPPTLRLLEAASNHPKGEDARVYWGCRALDGGVRSLISFDGERLSRRHWVNHRRPDESSLRVFEELLPLAEPREEAEAGNAALPVPD